MPAVSFGGLLVVALVAVGAPLLVGLVPWIRVPAVVLEIVAGIVLGPSGLGWVKVDLPIQILAVIGLAFLLFLAGLEIDVAGLRGAVLRQAGLGFGLTLVLGVAVGLGFHALGDVKSPLLLAVALSATSLGLVVPVLKDAGQVERPLGQLTIAGASVADFGAIVLLSLLFSEMAASIGSTLTLLGLFAGLVAAVGLAFARLNRSVRLDAVLVRLQDTTAEIRVRLAIVLLIGFVALAEDLGLETILGAFLAGAILNLVDKDSMSHPNFRLKLEAIGYGFVVPVFFIASGLRFDLNALVESPSAFLKVPLFLLALVLVRGVPALLYAPDVGRRAAMAAGLLQATSLPFLVTATQIGVTLGEIRGDTAAALVSAGLLSVVIFPLAALSLLGRPGPAAPGALAPAGVRP
ncbi:MAG TPA: cation:proton antiporter [Acidimicrobiales bacterium]|nr:cation:proton antiporter [Acidimicrobiales bacterium]